MITLKKCPFCGGEAKLQFDIADNAALGTPTMYIECVECFARPHIAFLSEENAGEQVMYIIDAWNEREGGEISQNEANASETKQTIPRFMTIHEVAKTGILSECCLRRMERRGELPAIKTGNRTLINFDRFLELYGVDSNA